MTVKISFIVPVYNGAEWVDRCLSSLRNQTLRDIEIIVVDDGSTDDSYKRCLAYKTTDARFHIYTIQHCGLSGARNFGLGKVIGNYIGFVDIDDWLDMAFSQTLFDILQKYDTDIASCISASDAQYGDYSGGEGQAQRYSPKEYLALEYRDPDINVRMGNKLYARCLFDGIRFPEGVIYEDVTTNYLLCQQCRAMSHINLPLHNYFISNQSITRSPLRLQDFDLPAQWQRVCQRRKLIFPVWCL